MKAWVGLFVVGLVFFIVMMGIQHLGWYGFFGIAVPYGAMAVFLIGVVSKVIGWARSPVPFRIPTTCGQQKSLPWVRNGYFDNPHTTIGVIGRMAAEVFLFRSLFRNTKTTVHTGPKVVYDSSGLLWLGALVFHWCMLIILVRHLRFFTEPVPAFVSAIGKVDGFFELGLPAAYLTTIGFLIALIYLSARRLVLPHVRYISLLSDYFPLFLLIGIAGTGVLLRHFVKIDLEAVKTFCMGLLRFQPVSPSGVHYLFYVHLVFVSVLFAYLPFSKLMHFAGVFLSPTRNLANNSRAKRHLNPWNAPVAVHTYEEYEDEFRERMIDAGIPVEKSRTDKESS